MYSAEVVLADNGFEGISITSSTAIVTFLSDLFIEAFLRHYGLFKYLSHFFVSMK